ncbi:agmatinase [Halobacteriales archaeon QS_6_64_34]|nr:MAG: agmatinase [Halobacteriales archaeon QS_6_64_34]
MPNDITKPQSRLPETAFGGINTFLGADIADPEQLPANTHIGVIGVPFDGAVSRRPGTRYGPSALRAASAWQDHFGGQSGGTYNVDTDQHINYNDLVIRDCGDAPTVPNDVERTRDQVAAYVQSVAESAFPVVLGGDHYITYPSFAGFANSVEGDVGLIHLDAHSDTMDDETLYGPHWHGSPMARIDDLPQGGYENHAMVGIRAYERAGFPDLVTETGLDVNYARDVRENGIRTCIEEAIDHATTGTDHVYLTVDIDVVDPSFAPGTGTPEPGGLTSTDLLTAMDALGRCSAIGAMDLMEVAPRLDPTDTTQMLGSMAIARFIESRFC